MKVLWATKVDHEGHRVREQLNDDKFMLEEAAAGMG